MRVRTQKGLLLLGGALLFALVPFLFWRATWFGRRLTDAEIARLLDSAKPRLVQHALSQTADRIIAGSLAPQAAVRIYPKISALARHPSPEIRSTAAWTMGQDGRSADFHDALLEMVKDPEPIVRRNAALGLVRFRDPEARIELLEMLRPFAIRSPAEGVLSFRLNANDVVNPGTLMARVDLGDGAPLEIRSPLPGRIERRLAPDGRRIQRGENILLLAPAPEQIWEALRALVLLGRAEDLPLVQRWAGPYGEDNDTVRTQAALTVRAIKSRM
jgi:hypothetical protein